MFHSRKQERYGLHTMLDEITLLDMFAHFLQKTSKARMLEGIQTETLCLDLFGKKNIRCSCCLSVAVAEGAWAAEYQTTCTPYCVQATKSAE